MGLFYAARRVMDNATVVGFYAKPRTLGDESVLAAGVSSDVIVLMDWMD